MSKIDRAELPLDQIVAKVDVQIPVPGGPQNPDPRHYNCPVHLLKEANGRYSIVAATLPGVASQGDTEEEALNNIVDAFKGVIAVYEESGEAVPWSSRAVELEPGAIERSVVVDV